MKKVSHVKSKYNFRLDQLALDHITRKSAIDIVATMPIEDLKKIFKTELKENEFEQEVVVSIEFEG